MNKEMKLKMIQKKSPELYDKVQKKELTVQQAYNEMYKSINVVSEFKGEGTKGTNKIGLDKEIERLMKVYKPSCPQLLESVKKQFPLTFDKHISEFIKSQFDIMITGFKFLL